MAFPNFWWGSFGKNLSTPLKRLPACRRLLFPYVCTQATEKSAFTFVNLLSLKVIHLPSQRCDVLQGLLPPPPSATIETSVKFRHFAELYCRSCQQITLKPGKFTSFRAFFFSGVDGFSPTDSCQKLKSHGRVYLVKHLAKLPLSGRCDYEKT